MLVQYILDLLSISKKKEKEWQPEPLYLEEIRPEDLPPNKGPFPSAPPNKRIIIIDI